MKRTVKEKLNIFIGIVLSFSIYGGVTFYIAIRSYRGIISFFPGLNVAAYIIICFFFAFSVFMRFMPVSYGLKRLSEKIGSYWIGIFVYLSILFLMADMIIVISRVIGSIPDTVTQDIRFWSFPAVVSITAGLMIYGKYNASKLRHVSYDIQTKKSSLSEEIKIVMIADIHLGVSDGEKNLPLIVENINSLQPDIVCIVGDIFNDDLHLIRNPVAVIESFKNIRAKYGVYACFGNHDGGKSFNEMVNLLNQSNITLLNDEHAVIDDRLVLIGRMDSRPIGGFDGQKRSDIEHIKDCLDTRLPVIVMDHDPSHIKEYGSEFDVLLFGHTHKGQMFPINLLTKSIFVTDYGYYRKNPDSPQVIVTSGVSTWGVPVRIGTSNEIVSVTYCSIP